MDKINYLLVPTIAFLLTGFSEGQDQSKSVAEDNLHRIGEFIEEKKKSLRMVSAPRDIFGLSQDARRNSRNRNTVAAAKVVPKRVLPLQEMVDSLPVKMVDSVHQRLVFEGSPPVGRGAEIEVDYQGEPILFSFEGVRGDVLYFRHTETKALLIKSASRRRGGISEKPRSSANGIQELGGSSRTTVRVNVGGSR